MTRITVGGRSSVSQTGTLKPIGTYAGEFNPAIGLPTVGTGRDNAILKGDYWKASGSGTIASLTPFTAFEAGDLIYAEINNASVVGDFYGNKGTGGDLTLAALGTTLQTSAADTPLDADTFNFYDAVDAILKKVTWANIVALLAAIFAPKFVFYNFADNGGLLPVAAKAGTLYIAEDDYNSSGGEWIPAGSWFISKVDGASLFSEYSIKL